MPLASLLVAILAPSVQAPTMLSRRFVANQKMAYTVTSHITAEQRQQGLQTFIPEDFDLNYGFTYQVIGMKNDGIAVLRYQRPSTTEIRGETTNSAPKAKTEKSDKVYQLTVSPVNELIDQKDVTPKKPTKPKKKVPARWTFPAGAVQRLPFEEYIGEMHRLALFAGSIDSSLDFAPKLPLEAVKVGDTWKRTVGYQPQKLKGKDGKSAVQRLDYTYTYLGPMVANGKPILRIQAKLDFDTDLIEFLKSMMEGQTFETNLKSMPLKMKATIDFDLDPKTRDTLSAAATSEGGFGLFLTSGGDAVVEERFKGRTFLELVGKKVIK